MSERKTTLRDFLLVNRKLISPDKLSELNELLNKDFFKKPLEAEKIRVLVQREIQKLPLEAELPSMSNEHTKRARPRAKTTDSSVGILNTMIHRIDLMTGSEFEAFLVKAFKAIGHDVEATPVSGDQGADLILDKDIAVQAKRTSSKVSNKAVQEVFTAQKYYDCTGAMVVTNGDFSEAAKDLAKKCEVELWSRVHLIGLVSKYLGGSDSDKNNVESANL